MERPDSVSLVAPPTITIKKTSAARLQSHIAIARWALCEPPCSPRAEEGLTGRSRILEVRFEAIRSKVSSSAEGAGIKRCTESINGRQIDARRRAAAAP